MDEELMYAVLKTLKEMSINPDEVNLTGLRNALAKYKQNNPESTNTRTIVELVSRFSDTSMPMLRNTKETPVDVSFFGSSNPYDIINIISPQSLYKKAYVGLQGSKATFSQDNKKISWVLSNIFSDGIQVKNPIRDIVEIKLLSYVMNLSLPTATSSDVTTVLIEEFASQSFAGPDRKFHFVSHDSWTTARIITVSYPMFAVYHPNLRKMIIDNSCHMGSFSFDPPVTILDTLTLSFGRPARVYPINGQSNDESCFFNFEVTYKDSAAISK